MSKFLNGALVLMIKFYIACLLSILMFSQAHANMTCSAPLQSYVKQIQKLPEGKQLIEAILKEGPLHFSDKNPQLTEQFGAMWDRQYRTIYVNTASQQSQGRILGTILFELHNARSNSRYDELDFRANTGRISKMDYVESMERVEYENSIATAALADKGIKLGYFPKEARLPIYNSFQEHYLYQRIGGHSGWLARAYDEISPKKSQKPRQSVAYAKRAQGSRR